MEKRKGSSRERDHIKVGEHGDIEEMETASSDGPPGPGREGSGEKCS